VLMSEEKLAIEVAQIDGIEIDNMDLTKTCKDEAFEKLASDSTGAHHQYTSLEKICELHVGPTGLCLEQKANEAPS
jgi:hypothetical protein